MAKKCFFLDCFSWQLKIRNQRGNSFSECVSSPYRIRFSCVALKAFHTSYFSHNCEKKVLERDSKQRIQNGMRPWLESLSLSLYLTHPPSPGVEVYRAWMRRRLSNSPVNINRGLSREEWPKSCRSTYSPSIMNEQVQLAGGSWEIQLNTTTRFLLKSYVP